MLQDEIKSLSLAFGHRYFLEAAMADMDKCVHPGALRIMGYVVYLYMIDLVRENLSWYLENDIISREAAKNLQTSYLKAVKDLLPHINDCVEAFGIPNIPHIHGPIARDFVKFNSQ